MVQRRVREQQHVHPLSVCNLQRLLCGPLLLCRVHRCWLVPHRMCVDSREIRCSSAESIGAGLYHIECVWTPVWSAAPLQSASVLACTTSNVCGLPCGPLLLCRVHRCWLVPHQICVDSRVVRCSSAECIGAGLYHIECVWTPVWSAAPLQSASVLACTTSNVCGLPCGPLLLCRVHRCWLVPHRMCVDSRVVRCSSAECIGAGLYHIECVWTPVWSAAPLQSASVLACVVRSAGTSGGPSKKKKHPLPARSNAASSLEKSRQRYKVSTFGSSGPRTDSGLCRGLKSLQVVPRRVLRTHFLFVINIFVRAFCFCCVLVEFFLLFLSRGCVTT